MVELQSCSSLVNASSACAIEQQENTNTASIIAEISAELERERKKNTQLLEKIAILEAQIQERDKDSLHKNEHLSNSPNSGERISKKFKRQKTETSSKIKTSSDTNQGILLHVNQGADCTPLKELKDANEHCLVNWMSMDETLLLNGDKFKDGNSALYSDYAEDSDDEDDDCYAYNNDISADRNNGEIDKNIGNPRECKEHINEGSMDHIQHRISSGQIFSNQIESVKPNMGEETNKNLSEDIMLVGTQEDHCESEFIDQRREGIKVDGDCKPAEELLASKKGVCHAVSGSLNSRKKPPKVAFCPKEVKRILESGVLKSKNAQSHTMRKIIVFASLGIRHGCEDMYELDFNHFRIMSKGEPYNSPDKPGEHVLYENPGVQRKIFYPNRKNPTLCPVQILEEEKEMRPSDDSCPSHLFLCIKYGGRTRNLPQNEYVRQRMGRNKLKSFGPIVCKMAMLVHIRTGSFFFKALGITLLFMAGFPDELVQRETKYRNLDLVQKYYRTDEDAEGEELFLMDSLIGTPEACPGLQSSRKTTSTKSKGKKQINFTTKPHCLPRPMNQLSLPLISAPPSQFGLTGYTSTQTNIAAASQPTLSPSAADSPSISNPAFSNLVHLMGYPGQTPYPMLRPHPSNSLMPMMYWPHNAFSPGLYPSTYGYQSFAPVGSYIPLHPHTFYGHPCISIDPKIGEGAIKSGAAMEDANIDSESSTEH